MQRTGLLLTGALLVAMVVGLYMMLFVLQDANDRIHAQDAKIGDLQRDTEPLIAALRPLVRDTRPVVREARQLFGPLARTADDLSAAAALAPQLTGAVRRLVGDSLPLVDLLLRATPDLLRDAQLGVQAAQDLEALQREALRVQKAQFRTQLETLAIQRQALTHIQSIDRKTGGDLAP